MPDNKRCNCRQLVGAKEESLVVLVNDDGFVNVESRLVVNGNPPEFFDFMTEVLTVEEINHPVATLVTALQEEELTLLMIIQLDIIKRWCGGSEISETNG